VGGRPQALVRARFSPELQENLVAGESGPTPPEFRGRVLRHRRAGPPMPDIAILYLGYSFRPSLPGGQRSSPTRPNQEQLSHLVAPSFESQSPYSPPVLIHLVAPLGTHLLDVEVTACRQGAQRDRRSNVQRTKARRGRCRSGDPGRTMAFSGGPDSETGSGARDQCGAPRNAGVQGGTESSNLLCSSSQSVSAVNPEAVSEKPRTLAAVCGWLGT
jgi:hypothetical protein